MRRPFSKGIKMNFQEITQKPLFKDAAFVFGLLLLIGAWKYVIEAD